MYSAGSWFEAYLDMPKTGSASFDDRFDDAGFDSFALIFNAGDIILIYFITFTTMLVYRVAKAMLKRRNSIQKILKRQLSKYSFGAFTEVFIASYLLVFHSAFLNVLQVNSVNILEFIQAILSIFLFGILALMPPLQFMFLSKYFSEIS